LEVAAGTLLFFWPVIPWVRRRLHDARERACDEWALHYGRLSPAEYASALVAIVRQWRRAPPLDPVLAIFGRGTGIERRIRMLLKAQHIPPLRAGHALAVALWALVTLGGRAVAVAKDDGPKVKPEAAATILKLHPEADTNHDGALSQSELCALDRRLYAEHKA